MAVAAIRPKALASAGKGRGKKIALGVVAVFVALAIIGNLAGDKKKNNKTTNPTASATGVKAIRETAPVESVTGNPQAPAQRRELSAQGTTATAPSVKLPDFNKVDYSYDFSKDDYRSIPPGATKKTRKYIARGDSDDTFNGKYAEDDGYATSSGKFINHGKATTWYDEARTKKHSIGWFLDNKMHGNVTVWYENGAKMYEYAVVKGEEHGLRRRWAANGQLTGEGYFYHDKKHGVFKAWRENGTLSCVTTWVNGVKEGPCTEYYENGNKETERFFVAGEAEGLSTRWYKNGQIHARGLLRKGDLHGHFQSWFDDGSPFEDLEYENGRTVYRKGSPIAIFLRTLSEMCESNNPQGCYMFFGPYPRDGFYQAFGAPAKQDSTGQSYTFTYPCGDGVVVLGFEGVFGGGLLLDELVYKRTSVPKTLRMTTGQFRSKLQGVASDSVIGVQDLLKTFGLPSMEIIQKKMFDDRKIGYTCSDGTIVLSTRIGSMTEYKSKRTEPASYRVTDIRVE
jgi:antitoxin component YwqK of YwqJK toxin-antitoxin module